MITERLLLRPPCTDDLKRLQAFETRNIHHFKTWQSSLHLPLEESLKKWVQEQAEGKACRFFLFSKTEPEDILGAVNFTQIFRGAFQACYLGYKIDSQFEGKGLMKEALQASIDYVFDELHLHRIMANYLPHNKRSAALLSRLGFIKEGFAKNYLLIDDKWEDHVLTALTNSRWIHHESR